MSRVSRERLINKPNIIKPYLISYNVTRDEKQMNCIINHPYKMALIMGLIASAISPIILYKQNNLSSEGVLLGIPICLTWCFAFAFVSNISERIKLRKNK